MSPRFEDRFIAILAATAIVVAVPACSGRTNGIDAGTALAQTNGFTLGMKGPEATS